MKEPAFLEEAGMNLESLKSNLIKQTKEGLPFILSSFVLWSLMVLIWIAPFENILTQNLFTFCITSLLMPLAMLFGKLLKINIFYKGNPLSKVGVLFTLNQLLYLLIVMWVYAAVPDKMVMVFAIVFGAHLLPFSWLYNSRAYLVMSILITVCSFIIGLLGTPVLVCCAMIIMTGVMSFWLFLENKAIIERFSQDETIISEETDKD